MIKGGYIWLALFSTLLGCPSAPTCTELRTCLPDDDIRDALPEQDTVSSDGGLERNDGSSDSDVVVADEGTDSPPHDAPPDVSAEATDGHVVEAGDADAD